MDSGFVIDGISIIVLLSVASMYPSFTNHPLFAIATIILLGRVLWREFHPSVSPPSPTEPPEDDEDGDDQEIDDVAHDSAAEEEEDEIGDDYVDVSADGSHVSARHPVVDDDLGKEFMLSMRTSGVYTGSTQGFYRNLVGEELDTNEGQRRRPYLMSRPYQLCPEACDAADEDY